MKKKAWVRIMVISFLIILIPIIAGCAPEEEVPTPEEAVLNITAGEGYFDPDIIMVDQGQEVTVFIANITEENHTFTIDELGIDVSLAPGEQEQVTFTATEEGTFEFYCDEPGHREAGMYGHLGVGEEPDITEDDDNGTNGIY